MVTVGSIFTSSGSWRRCINQCWTWYSLHIASPIFLWHSLLHMHCLSLVQLFFYVCPTYRGGWVIFILWGLSCLWDSIGLLTFVCTFQTYREPSQVFIDYYYLDCDRVIIDLYLRQRCTIYTLLVSIFLALVCTIMLIHFPGQMLLVGCC